MTYRAYQLDQTQHYANRNPNVFQMLGQDNKSQFRLNIKFACNQVGEEALEELTCTPIRGEK